LINGTCVVINEMIITTPMRAALVKVGEFLFARGTGRLNSNDWVRLGHGWKGTAQGGKTVFRLVIGNKRAVVRFAGKELRIHWHLP
jgi:hypothetical protein